jgi:hypothetical protein
MNVWMKAKTIMVVKSSSMKGLNESQKMVWKCKSRTSTVVNGPSYNGVKIEEEMKPARTPSLKTNHA